MLSLFRFLAVLAFALSLIVPAVAQDKPLPAGSLDAAIHDYIMRNPQVIRDSLAKAALADDVERTKRVLREQSAAIYRGGSPVVGAAEAKVTIVEFFDYNCPYCRKSYPGIRQLLSQNPDVRVVLKDVANLGKDSEAVSRLVIAARKQGKFQPFHDALMERQGRTTEAAALDLARKLGLDVEVLKKDAATPDTMRVLADTRALAANLSVEGTPLLIVGHNGIAGTPDNIMEQLTKFVAEVRQSGCDVC